MAVKPAGSSNNQLLKWATKISALVGSPAAGSITNAMLADMAASRFKARNSGGGTGPPEDLTGTQATALLDLFSSTLKGLVPLSGGGTTNFLRADGAFAAPTGLVAATQAEQEAASSTTVAVTPGRQHFHPSSPKAWGTVTYVGGIDAPALEQTFNVTSVTDGATNDTQFNFTVAFSAATYCAISGANQSFNVGVGSGGRATGNVLVSHSVEATTTRVTVICLGDQ
jgi:hypothetical protein